MADSSAVNQASACARLLPHISAEGNSDEHTAGRDAWPKSLQRCWASSCGHGTPAGLTLAPDTTGPGIGELIDGAVQQAPH